MRVEIENTYPPKNEVQRDVGGEKCEYSENSDSQVKWVTKKQTSVLSEPFDGSHNSDSFEGWDWSNF